MKPLKPKFFKTPAAFRTWLQANHHKKSELLVGFYKKETGKPSITWPESVDQALCFGWIDGIRKSIDEHSYCIRFTPRKPSSHWSTVNVKKIKELIKNGDVHPAGIEAFKKRTDERTSKASFEQNPKDVKLTPQELRQFKSNKKAWAYFQSRAPWYIRTATWWVISAKRSETRASRLNILIEDSGNELHIKQLRRN